MSILKPVVWQAFVTALLSCTVVLIHGQEESNKNLWNPFPLPSRNTTKNVYFSITDFGAVGDNSTLNTINIQNAIKAAGMAAKTYSHITYVVVPGNTDSEMIFKSGKVSLMSSVYLLIEPGATLHGSSQQKDYGEDWDYWHLVQGVNVSNTGIIGLSNNGKPGAAGGTLRGCMWQMVKTYDKETHSYVQDNWSGLGMNCLGECRPKNLAFIDAVNVTVVGIKILDSSDWTQLFRRCHNVLEERVYVEGNQQWGNNDGVDFESGTNLTVKNSYFRTGDDCLAFRSGNCNTLRTPWPVGADGRIQPVKGVTIENLFLSSSSAAIKLEALQQENHGDLEDVIIQDVTIRESNRGIGIWQRDGNGTLGNIHVKNVDIETQFVPMPQFWGSAEPLIVTSIPDGEPWVSVGLKGIHNVTFENIVAKSEGGALFSGLCKNYETRKAVQNLQLRNISITIADITNINRGLHDYRPLTSSCVKEVVDRLVDAMAFEQSVEANLIDVQLAFESGKVVSNWSMKCINYTPDVQITTSDLVCHNHSTLL
eukprot:m.66063 g.66063  ORF g.66063 m.66063 type:complete len:537 (+) comp11781_c0_seq4:144-1754(+)